jgi:3-hydroxybutyryl-CoA dehydratase
MRFCDLEVGMSGSIVREFSEQDVRLFSELSGDNNPIHLDECVAAKSKFGRRIVHGALVSSLFSAIFGAHIPGAGAIYVYQDVRFVKPVFLGSKVKASVELAAMDHARNRVHFDCVCHVDGEKVAEGKAVLIVP